MQVHISRLFSWRLLYQAIVFSASYIRRSIGITEDKSLGALMFVITFSMRYCSLSDLISNSVSSEVSSEAHLMTFSMEHSSGPECFHSKRFYKIRLMFCKIGLNAAETWSVWRKHSQFKWYSVLIRVVLHFLTGEILFRTVIVLPWYRNVLILGARKRSIYNFRYDWWIIWILGMFVVQEHVHH